MTSRIIAGAIKPLKVVIVGGVAGGAGAAARARRVSELSSIIMLERGKNVSIASCGLPFHVSGEIPSRANLLVTNPEKLRETLNLDVRVSHEVQSIDRKKKTVHVTNWNLPKDSPGSTMEISYDKLLLAMGAAPVLPPIPGLAEARENGRLFTLRNMEDMDGIIARVGESAEGGHVTIVGAGFIGLEMVEALSRCGLAVTLVEDKSSVLPLLDPEMSAPMADAMAAHGVRFIPSDRVISFNDNSLDSKVEVELSSGTKLNTNFVILSIGVSPESKLAADAGLDLTNRKAIVVNPYMQTSDPDIYAVGDVSATPFCVLPRQQYLPLGGPANRMARIAADHMFVGDAETDPYRGSFGTSIVRIFDSVAGKTGLGEADCIREGIEYGTSTITGPSHASYYPGSFPVTVKTLYAKKSGKILGAQVVGGLEGVDKRLDVMATALAGGLNVEDLAHLDLAYAPPFGSARDVINTAGFSGANQRSGMLNTVSTLEKQNGISPIVLDVRDTMGSCIRTLPSVTEGGVDAADVTNIPLEELRGRIDEVKAMAALGRPIVVMCNLGKFSYFATRILLAHGIESRSLSGGITMLRNIPARTIPAPISHASLNKSKSKSMSNAKSTGPSAIPVPAVPEAAMELLDVCGVSCPGPIMAIRKKIPSLSPGQHLCVKASDPGFYNDFPAFCRVSKLTVVSCDRSNGIVTGVLMKPVAECAQSEAVSSCSALAAPGPNNLAMVVFSGELDKVLAAFVLANGAIAMGRKVTMFFTFWGLNALRNEQAHNEVKDGTVDHPAHSMLDRMMGVMLPKGPSALPLTHMQMGGLGSVAMKMQMKQKHLPNLPDLMKDAIEGNVRMVACTMSMSAFGLESEDMIKDIEYGGVADFLEAAGDSKNTLFI
jgi:NADPH-dependent 2,4-dienoyl-CoA reductase/sulfur reductase-like enzyme/peroxiredoxin family protein/TusA-related sulfurtransferase/rhodanese-related sulfurtransferase